jgi:ParB/RepB/Spo0J family partition protein
MVIESIPVRLITPSRFRLREVGDIETLGQSIREHGVVVPLEVIPMGDYYEIVHGHRRFFAAQVAGLKHVPCLIRVANEEECLVRAILENFHREDMKPIDQARAIAHLMSVTGAKVVDLERQGFGNETHLHDLLRLLDQPDDIQALVGIGDPKARSEALSLAHVKAAIGPYQADILRKAAREGLTRNQTRQVTLTVSQAADEKRAKALITEVRYDTRVHDPEHEKARTERRAAKAQGGTGAAEPPDTPPTWPKKVTGILDAWTARIPELTAMAQPLAVDSPEYRDLAEAVNRLSNILSDLLLYFS